MLLPEHVPGLATWHMIRWRRQPYCYTYNSTHPQVCRHMMRAHTHRKQPLHCVPAGNSHLQCMLLDHHPQPATPQTTVGARSVQLPCLLPVHACCLRSDYLPHTAQSHQPSLHCVRTQQRARFFTPSTSHSVWIRKLTNGTLQVCNKMAQRTKASTYSSDTKSEEGPGVTSDTCAAGPRHVQVPLNDTSLGDDVRLGLL